MLKLNVKLRIALVAGSAIVALLVLAAGVKGIDFRNPSLAIPGMQQGAPVQPANLNIPGSAEFMQVLLLMLAISFIMSLIYLLLSKEARKRLLIQLVQLAVIISFFYFLFTRVKLPNMAPAVEILETLGSESEDVTEVALEPFSATVPSWLVYGLSLLAAAVIVWGAVRLWIYLQRRQAERSQTVQRLKRTIQSALDEIRSGGNVQDVILRCYYEMNEAASEKHGITRQEYVTPSEFTERLESIGLPAEQVERLTHLFESVRYGGKQPTSQQEDEAVACLSGIIETLGGGEMADGNAAGGKVAEEL